MRLAPITLRTHILVALASSPHPQSHKELNDAWHYDQALYPAHFYRVMGELRRAGLVVRFQRDEMKGRRHSVYALSDTGASEAMDILSNLRELAIGD